MTEPGTRRALRDGNGADCRLAVNEVDLAIDMVEVFCVIGEKTKEMSQVGSYSGNLPRFGGRAVSHLFEVDDLADELVFSFLWNQYGSPKPPTANLFRPDGVSVGTPSRTEDNQDK